MKKQDQFANTLLQHGAKEQYGSRKYRIFSMDRLKEKKIYLGKSGAVRVGKNIATSVSLSRYITGPIGMEQFAKNWVDQKQPKAWEPSKGGKKC